MTTSTTSARRKRDLTKADRATPRAPARMTLEELDAEKESLGDAIRAGQSLDDLGSEEANDSAWAAVCRLSDRYEAVKAEIDVRRPPPPPEGPRASLRARMSTTLLLERWRRYEAACWACGYVPVGGGPWEKDFRRAVAALQRRREVSGARRRWSGSWWRSQP